jgi:AraC-like DNA-binding protein
MIESSDSEVDPLSDLIRLAELRTGVSGELRASGAWALRMPPPEGLKFFAVLRGQACLQLEGGEPLQLGPGDVVVLNWQRTLLLASDLAAPEQDVSVLFRAALDDSRSPVVTLGDGSEFHQIGGHVQVDAERGQPLAEVLPPLIHLRGDAPQAPVLRWLVERLVQERGAAQSGHVLMTEQLAQILFLQALRIHLARGEQVPPSWLRAMSDERLQPALRRMHEQPGRDWQLEELASAAAMSRTSFAVRFKELAGVSPLAYLTQWRMQLARRALRRDPRPFGAWCADLGYASESAFSHAFKRVTGLSPAQYRARGSTPVPT